MATCASTGLFDPADMDQFSQVLAEWAQVAGRLQEMVQAAYPTFPVTRREKAALTTAEKLAREKADLSRVWDLVGLRMVIDGGRTQQDRIVRELVNLLPDASIKDRRDKSSSGYRAVHVLARQGRVYVEVQVRTRLQDDWAQMMERVADNWGRQIRYGGAPLHPRMHIEGVTRERVVAMLMSLSDRIDEIESQEKDIDSIRETMHSLPWRPHLSIRFALFRVARRNRKERRRLECTLKDLRRAVVIATEL